MTVYAEVLFAENFITGLLILLLTGKLRGLHAGKDRITAGAAMCGMYAFVLFIPLHWSAALGGKLLFSAAVVLAVFGRMTWRGFLKTSGVFYIVSFLMGGVTIAIMYLLKIPGMTGNGSFVIKGVTFLQLAAGIAATWYLGNWLAGLLREKNFREQVIHQVTFDLAGRRWQLKGLVDTGNSLRDPVTGRNVAVLSKNISGEIGDRLDAECFGKFAIIPYKTAGGASVMYGIRPDQMFIDGRLIENVVLGLGNLDFSPWRGCEKYDILLHQQFLEGEDYINDC